MFSPSFNLHKYLISLKDKLRYVDGNQIDLKSLDQVFLQYGQALYVIDYKTNQIPYSRNIEQILGYSKDEFNSKAIHGELLHPKQKLTVSLIIKSALEVGISGNVSTDSKFMLLYKIKHKTEGYKTFLRQTGMFTADNNSRMTSVYSIITDVTNVITTDKVEWSLEEAGEDFKLQLNQKLNEINESIFTTKEREILQYLVKGYSSENIAKKLKNSKHTIDTHRRRMLSKTNTSNTVELIYFAENLKLV